MNDLVYIAQAAALFAVLFRMVWTRADADHPREFTFLLAWWVYSVLSFAFDATSAWLHLGVYLFALPALGRWAIPVAVAGAGIVLALDTFSAWCWLALVAGAVFYARGFLVRSAVQMLIGAFFLYYAFGIALVLWAGSLELLPIVVAMSILVWAVLAAMVGRGQLEASRQPVSSTGYPACAVPDPCEVPE